MGIGERTPFVYNYAVSWEWGVIQGWEGMGIDTTVVKFSHI